MNRRNALAAVRWWWRDLVDAIAYFKAIRAHRAYLGRARELAGLPREVPHE